MKTFVAFLRLPAALVAFAVMATLLPAAAKKEKAPAKPVDLQVVVDVPPTWRPFLEDDIAEALFYRIQEVFKRAGYKGEMAQIDRAGDLKKDVPTLDVFLTEWRIDRVGNAQCTLSAKLVTAAGEKNLGLATGTAIFWANGPRWGFGHRLETADALEDAANNAAREVYDAVAKSGALPGIAPRK
ncbi:MAG TPA: hypothetical protein VF388_09935 [Lacunisphaera sp.]